MLPLLILVMLLSWVFWAAFNNPGLPIPKAPKWSLIGGGCLLALYFFLFLNVYVGLGVLAATIFTLLYLESRAATAIKRASEKKSKLNTSYAQMIVHHESGKIECTVTNGIYAGGDVRGLPQTQLVQLLSECEANDRRSAELLGLAPTASEANIRNSHSKLKRKFHPNHDGFDYLLNKIDQARDVALKTSVG